MVIWLVAALTAASLASMSPFGGMGEKKCVRTVYGDDLIAVYLGSGEGARSTVLPYSTFVGRGRLDTFLRDEVARDIFGLPADNRHTTLRTVCGDPVETAATVGDIVCHEEELVLFLADPAEQFFLPALSVGWTYSCPVPLHLAPGGASNGLRLTVLSVAPRIFELHSFLSDGECDHLIARAQSMRLDESRIGDNPGAGTKSDVRTSLQSWIGVANRNDDEVSIRVRARLVALTHTSASTAEDTQVVHYPSNTSHYYAHHDFTTIGPAVHSNPYYMNGGNRLLTAIYYLSDTPYGGETLFPYANSTLSPLSFPPHSQYGQFLSNGVDMCADGPGLRIPPRKGVAVLFYNLREGESATAGLGDPLTLHAGCDPRERERVSISGKRREGERERERDGGADGGVASKWIVNQWIRNKRVNCHANGGPHAHVSPDGTKWCLYDGTW